MNLPNSVRARWEDLRILDWTLITTNYVGLGTPLVNSARTFRIINTTDADLYLGLNGLTHKWSVPANSFVFYDLGANRSDQGGYMELPAGDRFYVRARTLLPTFGMVELEVCYASQV